MSKKCMYFVQHAWKQDLCANCFQSRDDHKKSYERSNFFASESSKNLKGILRATQNVSEKSQRKAVVFLESLIEVIGYGGDDLYSDESDIESISNETDETALDDIADTEEERILNNLTRSNTNFNRIAANLRKPSEATSNDVHPSTTSFVNLMLGNPPVDAEGKKKPLLVTVTPFGADRNAPTAEKSIVKKSLESRAIELRSTIKSNIITNATDAASKNRNVVQEKITDMPLIQSHQLVSIMEKTEINQMPSIADDNTRIKKNLPSEIPQIDLKNDSRLLSMKITNSKTPNDSSTQLETEKSDDFIAQDTTNALVLIKDESAVPDLKERTIEGESLIESINVNYDGQSLVHRSREDAGAPDGRADEDEILDTAVPSMHSANTTSAVYLPTPVPALPRSSFLHGETSVSKELINSQAHCCDSKSMDEEKTTSQIIAPSEPLKQLQEKKILLDKNIINVDSSGKKDCEPENRRRMAPKPPEVLSDDSISKIFARKPSPNINSDSPVVREREKRERATTCNLKMRAEDKQSFSQSYSILNHQELPEEPSNSKRSHCFARQNPTPSGKLSTCVVDQEDNKKKTKPRFSLKRLLRMGGSRRDMDVVATGSFFENVENVSYISQVKARPEIIHPLNLDGAAVEVLRHDKFPSLDDQLTQPVDTKIDDATMRTQTITARLGKPPPPPRNFLTTQKTNCVQSTKIRAPLMPKIDRSAELSPSNSDNQSWQSAPNHNLPSSDSLYANLAAEDVAGEVRSGLAPSKPQRTASLRGVQPQTPLTVKPAALHHQLMHEIDSPLGCNSFPCSTFDSHGVDHRPPSAADFEIAHRNIHNSHEQSTAVDDKTNNDHYHQRPRVFSRLSTHSASVSELSVVDGSESRHERSTLEDAESKANVDELFRVRQRRGRHTVHRSLEDNYGAVIVANYESLAQLLEQIVSADQSTPISSSHLRALQSANPCLAEFNFDVESAKRIGKHTFCSAMWNEHKLTLCFSLDGLTTLISTRDILLTPVIEFIDSISNDILQISTNCDDNDDVTVSVLRRLHVNTIKLFSMHDRPVNDSFYRHSCLILLQFVNALKSLQARGIEEFSKNLANVLLCKEEHETMYRLYILQSLYVDINDDRADYGSLCQCALAALHDLGLTSKLPVIRELLIRERAVSLSQVKAVLEYALWGPTDVSLGDWKEREIILQRWLDLERANILHTLVRSRNHSSLTVSDEYHVMFLVHTSAKIMCEASVLLLDDQRSMSNSLDKS